MAELGIDMRQPGARVLPLNHYTLLLYLLDTHLSKGKCEIKKFLTSLWALWNLLFVHSVLPVESVITERTFNLKHSSLFSNWYFQICSPSETLHLEKVHLNFLVELADQELTGYCL